MCCLGKEEIVLMVGARPSPLSLAQVKEVLDALIQFYPHLCFSIHTFMTTGDRDQTTSLRSLDRTNFFTKEIDDWVLEGTKRVGIHSAKDLAVPLAKGLATFCITEGIDSSDSLVFRAGESLLTLPSNACIATSSIRREEIVRTLRPDLRFCDIRGTIAQRLHQLERGDVDGVVVAEAALIRLQLTFLNRMRLPGITAEGQGKLAVVGREEDEEIKLLFSCLDVRLLR